MSGARAGSTARTAGALAVAAFLLYALSGGGRIVGSDEVTMFELSRALAHGGIAVPVGATLDGPDGRHYTKNAAGQAVLALPLVAASEAAARAAHLPAPRATLAARFGASFFNAVLTALLLAVFYAAARGLGVGARSALAAAALLGLTTPVWAYAKSFMAEPLESLGLLLALLGAARAGAGEERALPGERRWSWLAALGAFLAFEAKPSMLPFALLCLLPLGIRRPRRWLTPLAGVALAAAGHLAYDYLRFGTPLETGYGAQATPAGFTTPLLVGLYGLLLSSGKGVVWFAPALLLVPWGLAEMLRPRAHRDAPRHGGAVARVGWTVLWLWIAGLPLYAGFQHWAGDGSFGPRYLVPLLPPAFLAVAFALAGASRARRRMAWILGLAGLLVTLGGVSIYFGAQMREAGDYPYARPLDDPHFMEASHFNPRFSPIAGHWRMLARNAGEHLRGELPRLGAAGTPDPRLGVSAADQSQLLHALDFWWLYALYAGTPRAPVLGGALLLALLLAVALARLRGAFLAEARTG
ncbi:MAG: hypothetical protein HZC42_04630 [Candidatus Eisenbacteria bacterium]|nr:hypothetical protein [Candidatus Eisenbacteria bacterium]